LSDVVSQIIESIPVSKTAEPERASEKVTIVENKVSAIQPPLDKYAEVNGRPYVADYFGIDCWDELKNEKGLDIMGMRPKMEAIEKYVLKEIKDGGLKNTTMVFDNIIGKIRGELQLNDNLKPDKIIDRINAYIEIIKKQRRIDKEREALWSRK